MTFKEFLHSINIFGRMNEAYRHSYHLCDKDDSEYLSLVSDLMESEGIKNLDNYIQHSDITTLKHVICVSYITYKACKHFNLNYTAGARAGILHDYVTYDWHDPGDGSHRLHGFRHPGFALNNSKQITELSPLEENCIIRHMWPLTPIPPKYKEAFVLTLVDKYCATKETFRKYQHNPEEY